MIYNEIRILPYFFNHYDKFVSTYFIWDDHSDDGTTEFLKSRKRVKLLEMPFNGLNDDWARFNFWTLYKKYSRDSWRGKGADWVICVDADEFVYHPQLKAKLEKYKKEGYELVTPTGYTMISDGFPPVDTQLYDTLKYGFRDRSLSKPIVFRPHIDILFRSGRHSHEVLKHEDNTNPVRKKWRSHVYCLHYRHFGTDYYIERLKKNCERMSVTGDPYFEQRPVWPFQENRKWRMPDSSRALPAKWLEENLHKAIKVID
jgi:hypothetical protein